MRYFNMTDLEKAERRNGCWYTIVDNGRSMIPATHLGADCTAHVYVHPASQYSKGWVAWRLNDPYTGEVILRGTEDFHVPHDFVGAARRALKTIYNNGCTIRVRPGDRGPWYHPRRAG